MSAFKPKLSFLVSYVYAKRPLAALAPLRERYGDRLQIFIDSGAFTAHKQGKTIALDDYLAFIDRLPVKVDRHFMLDVIGDPEGTRRNLDESVRRGYEPIPIVTRGDSPDIIEHYYEHSDLVALGSVAGIGNDSAAWSRAMMQAINGRKAHILGMTRLDLVKIMLPWSVDSSSWVSGRRYGTVMVYDGHSDFHKIEISKPLKGLLPTAIVQRMKRYGFDAYELLQHKANRYGKMPRTQDLTTMSWCDFAIEMQKNIGTHFFFVCTDGNQITHIAECFEKVLAIRGDENV
jgi:hypothetical protein